MQNSMAMFTFFILTGDTRFFCFCLEVPLFGKIVAKAQNCLFKSKAFVQTVICY